MAAVGKKIQLRMFARKSNKKANTLFAFTVAHPLFFRPLDFFANAPFNQCDLNALRQILKIAFTLKRQSSLRNCMLALLPSDIGLFPLPVPSPPTF